MNNREVLNTEGFDGLTALIYVALITFGWVNIFSVVYTEDLSVLDFSLNSTKQLIWIGTSLILVIFILAVDYRSYETFAYVILGIVIVLLVLVKFTAREINGARSWIEIGGFRLQPSEFAKFTTALALAKYMSSPTFRLDQLKDKAIACGIVGLPALLIVWQGDAGSALVFSAFAFVLYREGIIPHWILLAGISFVSLFVLSLYLKEDEKVLYYLIIPALTLTLLALLILKRNRKNIALVLSVCILVVGFILGAKFIFENVLQDHQKNRIMVLLDPEVDPDARDERYNLHHSLLAIGSGDVWGKGFREGTQTKLKYVPEQSTDFIFCTVGEEYGWIGGFFIVGLFTSLLYRIVLIAERQRDKFVRIYAYSVAGIIFFHFTLNISMTTGLFPVIGIPLPFISYGGSSLWSFTILLFILLKLDAHRDAQVDRQ